jgi:hypothetical protein
LQAGSHLLAFQATRAPLSWFPRKLVAAGQLTKRISADALTTVSIKRVPLALQLQNNSILLRQFNFWMAVARTRRSIMV